MDNLVSHADYFAYADAKINRLETSLAALQTENAELKWQVTGWKYNCKELKKQINRRIHNEQKRAKKQARAAA